MDVIIQVKQSLYTPWQELRVPGVRGSKISKHSTHEGGKVVSPRHRPPVPPAGNIPGTHFCQRLSRSQGHSTAVGLGITKRNCRHMITSSRDLLFLNQKLRKHPGGSKCIEFKNLVFTVP